MRVKVNRRTIEIFEGAIVKNALWRYFVVKKLPLAQIDVLAVYDADGHEIDLDAPLHDGQHIIFKLPKII
ncbi:MAG: hypothetical protein J5610_01780 [Prevotella sp.]|nr:hypothetical protein [Prevotella sp.]